MPQTVAQIDALLALAYAAINVNELSFVGPSRRATVFHSLTEFTQYINWLEGERVKAVEAAATAAGTGGYAPVVRYQGPQS